MTQARIRPRRYRSGVIALGTVVALGVGGAFGTTSALAATAATARINAYGGPMCADRGAAVRVELAVKPRVGTTIVKVVDKYMDLTRIQATANAWLLHLKSPGNSIPSHTAKVFVRTAAGTQTLLVAIPAFSCGPPVVVVLAGVGGPMCAADGTAVRASITIKPKDGTAIVGVADAFMSVTNIDSTANAWVIHLKRNAPSVPAHIATVTVATSTGNQVLAVPIPAFVCR